MNLGILFSGGKDSYLAMQMAAETHDISCLLTIDSLIKIVGCFILQQ